ncbi:MAG TPA: RidA family protein [Tepidiformaceae bacterium]|nr:RidA family protein [Tepidiformaceae bacterium]
MSAEAKLKALGIELPAAPAAAGLYAPCVRSGNQVFVSGQVPVKDGAPMRKGKLGQGVTIDDAAGLARQCALQALAIVRAEVGSLDRVTKVLRVGGFVASADGFTDHPKVINGASQLLLDVFGEAGRHARIAVGQAELPFGVPVEVEFLFEVAE